MKLWRKLASKGNGRSIKQTMMMQEMMMKNVARSTPLLDALFKRAGITYNLSQKQQAALKKMIEDSKEEATDAAV